jgi:Cupin-like domain
MSGNAARALLSALLQEPWLEATASELTAQSTHLGELLQRAMQVDRAAATALLDALWSRAKSDVGWNEPVWREVFVVASVCAAVAAVEHESRDGTVALRRLDEAFIMGGPAEILQPFVDLVEPLVLQGHDFVVEGASATPEVPKFPTIIVALPRLQDPTPSQFSDFFRADRPCCMTGEGIASGWPALQDWKDWGWWTRRYGHRHVPLEVGAFNDPSWHEEVASISDFVRRVQGSEIVYLAQHTLFDQLPDLREHFREPDVVRGRVTRTNAWIGSANTVTPLHFDSYDGILTQVVGYKHVRLFPPSDTRYLYPTNTPWTAQRRWPTAENEVADGTTGSEPRGTISLVDIAAPDARRFPLFEKAGCVEVVLAPGDAVYIPSGWWHWVRALTQSISISFVL